MSTITMSNHKILKNYRLQEFLLKNTIARRLRNLIISIENTIEIQKSRKHLGKLDKHLLKDIGISAVEAKKESQKFFWQK